MSESKIPERLKHFIFRYIESVEILEILLYLHSHQNEWKTAAQVDEEIKTQQTSISKRLTLLKSYGLVEENPVDATQFRYLNDSSEVNEIVANLATEYKIRRHQIYEIIFSQKTHLKTFADAFVVIDRKSKKGDDNG